MSAADVAALQRFHDPHYLRHNRCRQDHLASLGLPLDGRSVLEVGAGIGDHSAFFLDRGCDLTITEGRPESVAMLRERFPDLDVQQLDLDDPPTHVEGRFDIVYGYGVLYHLARPAEALEYLAARCAGMLLLETCVLPTAEDRIVFFQEPAQGVENSLSGTGCRPSRAWVFRELARHFPHVYLTRTQPRHDEFPVDWTVTPPNPWLVRAVFVASRDALDHDRLSPVLLDRQER